MKLPRKLSFKVFFGFISVRKDFVLSVWIYFCSIFQSSNSEGKLSMQMHFTFLFVETQGGEFNWNENEEGKNFNYLFNYSVILPRKSCDNVC